MGGGDVAGGFDFLPRNFELFGADEAEHFLFAAVFAHQCCRQAQAAACLQARGQPEDGCGQQVDFVVDNQAPVARIEQLQVQVGAFAAGGEHLVGGDCDRSDLFDRTGVFADFIFRQAGAAQQFGLPLFGGHRIGHQDKRRCAHLCHGRGTHNGFSGTAGQDDYTGFTAHKGLHGFVLVWPQVPLFGPRAFALALIGAAGAARPLAGAGRTSGVWLRLVIVEVDRVCFTVDVAGVVGHRVAQFEQAELQFAAFGRVHLDGAGVDPGAEDSLHFGLFGKVVQQRGVGGFENQAVHGRTGQHQHPEAVHEVDDFQQEFVRDGVFGVFEQGVDDGFGVVAGGARVPQSQRGDGVRVNVFGCARKLGERRDGRCCFGRVGVAGFQKDCAVGLDDEGTCH